MTTTPETRPEPGWGPRLRVDVLAAAELVRDQFDDGDRPTLHEIAAPFLQVATDLVRTREAMTKAIQGQKAERDATIAALTAQLADRDRHVRDMGARITQLTNACSDNAAARSAFVDELGDHQRLLREVRAAANHKDAAIGALTAKLAEQEKATADIIRDLHHDLRRQEDVVQELRGALQAASAQPSPEMREVPACEVREGDAVELVRRGRVAHTFASGFAVTWDQGGGDTYELGAPGLTVTRPVSPLPDKPGAVIRCRVVRGEDAEERSVVAELRDTSDGHGGFWYGTDGWAYRQCDIVRVISELEGGNL